LSLAKVEPRNALIRDGRLLIADFRVKGEYGALLELRDWRPAAAATARK
jgi:hypothetical protein